MDTPHAAAAVSLRRTLPAFAVVVCAALVVAWVVWQHNFRQLCRQNEWPAQWVCPELHEGPLQKQARLLRQIARNPGDSDAWIELADVTRQLDAPAWSARDVLEQATRLSPEDPRIQRMQVARAYGQGQWEQAVHWLIRLVQDNQDGWAAVVMARLMQHPPAVQAMMPHVKPGATWLGKAVDAMREAKVPVVHAMPLVVQALGNKSLSPALAMQLLGELKAQGNWLEAHAVWSAWIGRAVPLLYNGGFDETLMDAGLDWEITPMSPSRAGALIEQVEVQDRGGVLSVEFNGKPMSTTLVRQYVVQLGGNFRFSGQYRSSRLSGRDGLVWAFVCTGTGEEVARTVSMQNTQGQWRSFSLDVLLPKNCGRAVSVQLQTALLSEALTGLRGDLMVDNLSLVTLP